MPANTAVPSDWRISAPAPVATTSGATPRMNANDVIRIGRSRVRAARTAASPAACTLLLRLARELDDQDRVLGGQTDQHDEADLRQDVDRHARASNSPVTDASRHIGTISTTASGSFQLSYCAASTRNTNRAAAPNTSIVGVPFCCCWKAISVHSKPMPGGKTLPREFLHPVQRRAGRNARRGDALHLGRRRKIVARHAVRAVSSCRRATVPIGTISPAALRAFRPIMSLGVAPEACRRPGR